MSRYHHGSSATIRDDESSAIRFVAGSSERGWGISCSLTFTSSSRGVGVSSICVWFLFLRRKRNIAIANTANTAATTPTTIPAIAPLLSPEEDDCKPSPVAVDACPGVLALVAPGVANVVAVAASVDVINEVVTVDVDSVDVDSVDVDSVDVDSVDVDSVDVDSVDVAVEEVDVVVALEVTLEVDPQMTGSLSLS
jgi:hypothetical protein